MYYGKDFVNKQKRTNSEKLIIQNYIKNFGQQRVYNLLQNKKWKSYRRSIKIRGKLYPSLRQAAKILKESRTNITRKCDDPKNSTYFYYETIFDETRHSKRSAISCCVHDKIYSSLTEAARDQKMHFYTVKKRCLSKHFSDCYFL